MSTSSFTPQAPISSTELAGVFALYADLFACKFVNTTTDSNDIQIRTLSTNSVVHTIPNVNAMKLMFYQNRLLVMTDEYTIKCYLVYSTEVVDKSSTMSPEVSPLAAISFSEDCSKLVFGNVNLGTFTLVNLDWEEYTYTTATNSMAPFSGSTSLKIFRSGAVCVVTGTRNTIYKHEYGTHFRKKQLDVSVLSAYEVPNGLLEVTATSLVLNGLTKLYDTTSILTAFTSPYSIGIIDNNNKLNVLDFNLNNIGSYELPITIPQISDSYVWSMPDLKMGLLCIKNRGDDPTDATIISPGELVVSEGALITKVVPGDKTITVCWNLPSRPPLRSYLYTIDKTAEPRCVNKIQLSLFETSRESFVLENLINGHRYLIKLFFVYEKGDDVSSPPVYSTPAVPAVVDCFQLPNVGPVTPVLLNYDATHKSFDLTMEVFVVPPPPPPEGACPTYAAVQPPPTPFPEGTPVLDTDYDALVQLIDTDFQQGSQSDDSLDVRTLRGQLKRLNNRTLLVLENIPAGKYTLFATRRDIRNLGNILQSVTSNPVLLDLAYQPSPPSVKMLVDQSTMDAYLIQLFVRVSPPGAISVSSTKSVTCSWTNPITDVVQSQTKDMSEFNTESNGGKTVTFTFSTPISFSEYGYKVAVSAFSTSFDNIRSDTVQKDFALVKMNYSNNLALSVIDSKEFLTFDEVHRSLGHTKTKIVVQEQGSAGEPAINVLTVDSNHTLSGSLDLTPYNGKKLYIRALLNTVIPPDLRSIVAQMYSNIYSSSPVELESDGGIYRFLSDETHISRNEPDNVTNFKLAQFNSPQSIILTWTFPDRTVAPNKTISKYWFSAQKGEEAPVLTDLGLPTAAYKLTSGAVGSTYKYKIITETYTGFTKESTVVTLAIPTPPDSVASLSTTRTSSKNPTVVFNTAAAAVTGFKIINYELFQGQFGSGTWTNSNVYQLGGTGAPTLVGASNTSASGWSFNTATWASTTANSDSTLTATYTGAELTSNVYNGSITITTTYGVDSTGIPNTPITFSVKDATSGDTIFSSMSSITYVDQANKQIVGSVEATKVSLAPFGSGTWTNSNVYQLGGTGAPTLVGASNSASNASGNGWSFTTATWASTTPNSDSTQTALYTGAVLTSKVYNGPINISTTYGVDSTGIPNTDITFSLQNPTSGATIFSSMSPISYVDQANKQIVGAIVSSSTPLSDNQETVTLVPSDNTYTFTFKASYAYDVPAGATTNTNTNPFIRGADLDVTMDAVETSDLSLTTTRTDARLAGVLLAPSMNADATGLLYTQSISLDGLVKEVLAGESFTQADLWYVLDNTVSFVYPAVYSVTVQYPGSAPYSVTKTLNVPVVAPLQNNLVLETTRVDEYAPECIVTVGSPSQAGYTQVEESLRLDDGAWITSSIGLTEAQRTFMLDPTTEATHTITYRVDYSYAIGKTDYNEKTLSVVIKPLPANLLTLTTTRTNQWSTSVEVIPDETLPEGYTVLRTMTMTQGGVQKSQVSTTSTFTEAQKTFAIPVVSSADTTYIISYSAVFTTSSAAAQTRTATDLSLLVKPPPILTDVNRPAKPVIMYNPYFKLVYITSDNIVTATNANADWPDGYERDGLFDIYEDKPDNGIDVLVASVYANYENKDTFVGVVGALEVDKRYYVRAYRVHKDSGAKSANSIVSESFMFSPPELTIAQVSNYSKVNVSTNGSASTHLDSLRTVITKNGTDVRTLTGFGSFNNEELGYGTYKFRSYYTAKAGYSLWGVSTFTLWNKDNNEGYFDTYVTLSPPTVKSPENLDVTHDPYYAVARLRVDDCQAVSSANAMKALVQSLSDVRLVAKIYSNSQFTTLFGTFMSDYLSVDTVERVSVFVTGLPYGTRLHYRLYFESDSGLISSPNYLQSSQNSDDLLRLLLVTPVLSFAQPGTETTRINTVEFRIYDPPPASATVTITKNGVAQSSVSLAGYMTDGVKTLTFDYDDEVSAKVELTEPTSTHPWGVSNSSLVKYPGTLESALIKVKKPREKPTIASVIYSTNNLSFTVDPNMSHLTALVAIVLPAGNNEDGTTPDPVKHEFTLSNVDDVHGPIAYNFAITYPVLLNGGLPPVFILAKNAIGASEYSNLN